MGNTKMATITQQERWQRATDQIRGVAKFELGRLSMWNYAPCEHHSTPDPECVYRKCGGEPYGYQTVAAVYHYLARKSLETSKPGLGKSIIIALTMCIMKERGHPLQAVLVVPTPSAEQWAAEMQRWAPGLRTEMVPRKAPLQQRLEYYSRYPLWEVLVVGYHVFARDAKYISNIPLNFMASDDVDPLHNVKNATHRAVVSVAKECEWVIVANATPTQTHLLNLYGATVAIGAPQVWGNKTTFERRHVKRTPVYIRVKNSDGEVENRKTFPVTGYQNMDELARQYSVMHIRYTYDDVANDVTLPDVVSSEVMLELTDAQRQRYEELQEGVFTLNLDGQTPQQQMISAIAQFSQPLDSRVLTPKGWKRMGDMQEGDAVLSPSGATCKVMGVSDTQIRSVYRVTLADGSSCEASDTHLWQVSYKNHRNPTGWTTRITTTEELFKSKLNIGSREGALKYRLPDVTLDTEEKSLPIPPYTLGALLGDGGMTTRRVDFGCKYADEETLHRILNELGPRYSATTSFDFSKHRKSLYIRSGITYDKVYFTACQSCEDSFASVYARGICKDCYWKHRWARTLDNFNLENLNPLMVKVRELGVNVPGHQKFIPEPYMMGSRQQRLDLLRGLMDTEGNARPDGSCQVFTSTSESLAQGVQSLVRSLGGSARITRTEPSQEDGFTRRPKWDVFFAAPVNPFYLRRKSSLWRPPTRRNTRNLKSIEYIGEKEVKCIMLDSDDHLYVTDNYIVTHNTRGAQVCAGLQALGEPDGPQASCKLDWIENNITSSFEDESVIIYATHKKTITALKSRLKKHNIGFATIDGSTKDKKSEQDRFWQDPACRVMILSAAGERSLNLQCASVLIMLDSPWNPARVQQIAGRLRRVGSQHSTVRVFKLYAVDTQEDKISKVLAARQVVADVVNQEEDDSNLFQALTPDEILKLIRP